MRTLVFSVVTFLLKAGRKPNTDGIPSARDVALLQMSVTRFLSHGVPRKVGLQGQTKKIKLLKGEHLRKKPH